jgi:hypothetical protein
VRAAAAAEGSWERRKRTRKQSSVRTGTKWMDLSGAAGALAFTAFSSAGPASSSAAALTREGLPAGEPRERRCIAAAAAAAAIFFSLSSLYSLFLSVGAMRGVGRGDSRAACARAG